MPFSGFQDFDPRFASMFQQYIAANPGVGVFSGYRSPARQAQLFANSDRSGHWVARNSLHTQGIAADLAFNGTRFSALPASQQEALHRSAGGFGLKFPMSWEPWHVEPYWSRGGGMAGGGALPSYVASTGSPGSTVVRDVAAQNGGFDLFSGRNPASGMLDLPTSYGAGQPQEPPMTPERFLVGMIAGQNPLRQMVLGRVAKLFG